MYLTDHVGDMLIISRTINVRIFLTEMENQHEITNT